jgi:hypothetical protein
MIKSINGSIIVNTTQFIDGTSFQVYDLSVGPVPICNLDPTYMNDGHLRVVNGSTTTQPTVFEADIELRNNNASLNAAYNDIFKAIDSYMIIRRLAK